MSSRSKSRTRLLGKSAGRVRSDDFAGTTPAIETASRRCNARGHGPRKEPFMDGENNTSKRRGGRAPTGQLIWRPSGWYGRVRVEIDGERVRVSRPLGTKNRAVAKRKL